MIKDYLLKSCFLLLCLASLTSLQAQDVHFDWVKSIGGQNDELGHSVAVDDSGNVFTIGYFRETADFNIGSTPYNLTSAADADVFVSKHDKNGAFVWAKRYGGTRNDEGNSIVADKVGNIYITGRFVDEMNFGTIVLKSNGEEDIFIAKLDTDGNCLWAKNIGNDGDQIATAIALDPSNASLYVVGSLMKGDVDMNPGGNPAILAGECLFVLKLKINGDFIWAKRVAWDAGYISLAESLDAIAVSEDNHLHIGGQFLGTVDFDPIKSGKNLTSQAANGNNFEDAFILKLDSMGRFVWVKALTGTGRNYLTGIATDSKGNVYSTGSFDGNFNPGTGSPTLSTSAIYSFATFVSKLDINGNYVWAKQIGGQNATFSRGFGIDVDDFDNIYTTGGYGTGNTTNKVDFNPSPAIADTFYLYTTTGSSEAFALKLYENGDFAWAKTIAQGTAASVAGGRQGIGIVTDKKGSVYTTGGFQGTVDFDPSSTKTSILSWKGHNNDVFIHKMSCGSAETEITLTLCEPYVWNGIVYAESGIYTHNFSSGAGCDSIVTLDLTIHLLEKPIINVDSFQLSTVQNYDQYQWFLNDNLITGATSRNYTVLENGNYTVAVENKNGCKDTSDVYTVTNVTGIDNNLRLSNEIKVFPNPSTGIFTVFSPIPINLAIFSIDGRLIKNFKNEKSFSILDMASGLYLLRITNENNQLIKNEKLIKMNP